MTTTIKQLRTRPCVDIDHAYHLQHQLGIPLVLARAMVDRGLTDEHKLGTWLVSTVNDLLPVDGFAGIDAFLARVHQARERQEHVVVYGDYDVDGVTATTIMVWALHQVGLEHVTWYVPNRFKDGYGPNLERYAELARDNDLLITVDNGITGESAIQSVQGRMDVLVTDHHDRNGHWPKSAQAVVYPRTPEHYYANADLVGAGVAFKVAQALLGRVPTEVLDLVTLATIADVGPLSGENRTLVQLGLHAMADEQRLGLRMLLLGLDWQPGQTVTSETVAFQIAPTLNAPGRLTGEARNLVDLFLTGDEDEAQDLARWAIEQNQTRKDRIKYYEQEAMTQVQPDEVGQVIVLKHPDDPTLQGLVGLVAGRVMERTQQPTIVLAENASGFMHGSGRAPQGYNLMEALGPHQQAMVSFGGHAKACGLSLYAPTLPGLRSWLKEGASLQRYQPHSQTTLWVDGWLEGKDWTNQLGQQLSQLGPFGESNRQPVLGFKLADLTFTPEDMRWLGKDQATFKLHATVKATGLPIDIMQFRVNTPDAKARLKATLFEDGRAAGTLSWHEYRGRGSWQVLLSER